MLNPVFAQERKIDVRKIIFGAFGTDYDCVGVIEKTIEPKTGGIYIKFEGCKQLMRGHPDTPRLESVGICKALIASTWRKFLKSKTTLFLLAVIFPFYVLLPQYNKKSFLKCILLSLTRIFERALKICVLPVNKYSEPVREIYRVLSIHLVERKERELERGLWWLKNVICMIIEYDLAYRFILQDVIYYLDKDNLKKKPIKEITKLIDIIILRYSKKVSKNWKKIKLISIFILFFHPQIKKKIVDILLDLQIKKLVLNDDDWYFCLRRKNYKFRGMTNEERLKEKEKIDKEFKNNIPKITVDLNKNPHIII